MPADFVHRLFDDYAPHFEEHLRNQLKYQGPELLLNMASRHCQPAPGRFDAIDLGCGTGLCGALFRPFSRKLSGVDLSPRMVEQAQRRAIYDDLHVADVVEHLRARPSEFNLLLAGDLLAYIGDLHPLFDAAHAALRPGGWFILHAEAHETGTFSLNTTRRFSHSLDYIRQTAADVGLTVIDTDRAPLRMQHQKPVEAWTVLLQRPAS